MLKSKLCFLFVSLLIATTGSLFAQTQNCNNATILIGDLLSNGSGAGQVVVFPFSTSATPTMCPTPIPFGGEGMDVDPVKKVVYIVEPNTGILKVYNYQTQQVSTLLTLTGGAFDMALSPDKNYIYVNNAIEIKKIDVNTGTIVATRPVGDFPGAGALWGIAINPANGDVYVSRGFLQSATEGQISKIDANLTSSPSLIATAPQYSFFQGLYFHTDGTLWAVTQTFGSGPGALQGTDAVYHFQANGTLISQATMPNSPYNFPADLAVGPDGNVYVATFEQQCVLKYNVSTNAFSVYLPADPNSKGKTISFVCDNFVCPGQCNITIKPTVSGCYSPDGVASKATVSIEVGWINAPAGNITVSYMGQTKTITPGLITVNYGFSVGSQPQTIVSPQVVAFEVDLPGTSQTATATFDNSPTCTATSAPIVLPAACPRRKCDTGELAGTVFNDFNADGIRQAGESAGIPGVTVTAIACDGTKYTATTDAFGDYNLTIPAAKYPVRVEFTNLPGYAGQGTLNGTDGRTTVQFVQSANCNIDLGVLDPNDYCQTNPKIVVPCYLNGDPSDLGSANDVAIVSLDYTLAVASKTGIAKIPEIGAVWGTAYAKKDNSVYTAAVLRRHTGLTDAGLGGIFKTDLTNNSTILFADVETLGVNLGSIPSNATRGLGAKTAPTQDEEAYSKVGKTGMGDLDISGDGSTLYFVNLFEKKLHSLSTINPTSAPGVAIPNPGCGTSGDYRPWALKIYKGFVYVGVVCDAATGSKSNLRAYIYKYDISTNTFNTTPVLDFPLTYPKGFPSDGDPTLTGWFPWSDNFNDAIALQKPAMRGDGNYGDVVVYPQPILADIEFDIDGSMVLGFADRFAFQTGNRNYAPNSSTPYGLTGSANLGYSGIVAGDILRAYSNGTTFVLENNAKAGPSVGAGPGNNQGPGFGEFYNDNFLIFGDRLAHAENANGGLALRPGSGETIYVAMDPENEVADSGGLRKVSNTSGQPTGAITITTGFRTSGLFAKAASLGDLEIACATPTYLEIGNRVWLDTNKDGVQDACEKALAGVKVALYQGNTLIANTTTDANGEYYFSNGSDVNAVNKLLQPNTAYTVRFGTDGTSSQFNSTTNQLTVDNGKYTVTTAFSTAPGSNTLNDSNAQLAGGFLSANVTTGAYGSVNHTIDAGFVCVPTTVATISPVKATCTGTTANNNAQIQLTGIVCADKVFLVTAGSALPAYTAAGSQPVSNSTASFSNLPNPATSAGQSYSLVLYNGPCCYTVITTTLPFTDCSCITPTNVVATATPASLAPGATITLNATAAGTTAGTTYTWSGPGISSPTASTIPNTTVAAPATAGVYTYTVVVSNVAACTAMATASVTVIAPVCSLSITAGPVDCVPVTGKYTVLGTLSLTNAVAGTATISDGTASANVVISAGATSIPYSLTGLTSGTGSHTVTVSLQGCGTATTTYQSPNSCLCPTGNCFPTTVRKN